MSVHIKPGKALVGPLEDNRYFYHLMHRKIREINEDTRYHTIIMTFLNEITELKHGVYPDINEKRILSVLEELWSDTSLDFKLLSFLNDFENILQKTNKNYRDHFVHSFNTFILGYYLLNKIANENPIFDGRGDRNAIWMVTSTYHDVAYTIQELDSWINEFIKSYIDINPKISLQLGSIMPPIYNHFMETISIENRAPIQSHTDGKSQMDWGYYNKLNEALYADDHGVLSGLILAHYLSIQEEMYEERGYYGDFAVTWMQACHAICSHTLDFTSDFSVHPYAYLLKLCDNLQDWGRPSQRKRRSILNLHDVKIENGIPIRIKFDLAGPKDRFDEIVAQNEKVLSSSDIDLIYKYEKASS